MNCKRSVSKSASEDSAREVRMSRVPSATRLVAYLPSFKTIVQRLRATSATPSSFHVDNSLLATPTILHVTPSGQKKQQQAPANLFPDVLLTPSSSLAAQLSLHTSHPPPSSTTYTNTAISTTLTTSTVTPINTASNEDEEEDASPLIWTSIKCKPNGTVECLVQEVPEFLLANLLQLFPGMSLHGEEKLSVIVLSQRTVNDMMSWSIEVEAERMQLLEYFIDSAKEVCSRLSSRNHWADFIDPSSGRAYFSPYSSCTLFETDDRFQYLGGFDIVDLGCCKYVHHPAWGSFTFVGCIFTTAPSQSPVIRTILEL